MKQIVILLVMVLVGLQTAAAAMGGYCRHESGSAAAHFGHHAHTHHVSGDDTKQVPAPGDVHTDCGTCSAAPVALAAPGFGIPAHAAVVDPPSYSASYADSIPPERPERPKWILPRA